MCLDSDHSIRTSNGIVRVRDHINFPADGDAPDVDIGSEFNHERESDSDTDPDLE